MLMQNEADKDDDDEDEIVFHDEDALERIKSRLPPGASLPDSATVQERGTFGASGGTSTNMIPLGGGSSSSSG